MARRQIIEKLRNELSQDITTERQVVYILAEIRKYLELINTPEKFSALYFYCCWALHTRMNREGAVRILERFDKAHRFAIASRVTALNELPESIREDIQRTMMYAKFVEQFHDFVKTEQLVDDLVRDVYRWVKFLSLYTDIIEECPLELAGQGIRLKHVKAVDVKKVRRLPSAPAQAGIIMFGSEWRVRTADPQERGSWTVYFAIDKQQLTPSL